LKNKFLKVKKSCIVGFMVLVGLFYGISSNAQECPRYGMLDEGVVFVEKVTLDRFGLIGVPLLRGDMTAWSDVEMRLSTNGLYYYWRNPEKVKWGRLKFCIVLGKYKFYPYEEVVSSNNFIPPKDVVADKGGGVNLTQRAQLTPLCLQGIFP
jgi:hypothetical protein